MTNKKHGALAPTTMTEAIAFAEALALSNMVPSNFKGKPGDILVAVQWGSEVGLPPMSALQNIAIINGKPTIYGDAALALITSHPQYAGHHEVIKNADDKNEAVAYCVVKRKVHGRIVKTERTFAVKDAKRANLWGKRGPWTDYPKRMLQMRARGFALRDSFPDALKGVITYEEAADIGDDTAMKDVTPANPLDTAFGEEIEKIDALGSPQIDVADIPIPTASENGDVAVAGAEGPVGDIDERAWEMRIGEEIISLPNADEFYDRFCIEIKAIANASDDFAACRHDASVFKKANDDT